MDGIGPTGPMAVVLLVFLVYTNHGVFYGFFFSNRPIRIFYSNDEFPRVRFRDRHKDGRRGAANNVTETICQTRALVV